MAIELLLFDLIPGVLSGQIHHFDNKITIEDLRAAELNLKNPNLAPHKRAYWENIVSQLKTELKKQNPEDNIKTYN